MIHLLLVRQARTSLTLVRAWQEGYPPAPPVFFGVKMAREKRITVRLTTDQFEQLEKLRGNIPKSEFLYLIILDYLNREQELVRELQRIYTDCLKKCEAYRELHGELGKIGSNINQVAIAMNRKKLPAKERKVLLDLVVETLSLVQDLKLRLSEERGSQGGRIKESS